MKILEIEQQVLEIVAGIDENIQGAHSLRINGQAFSLGSSENITVTPRENKDGITIHIKENTPDETMYIPVVISQSGVTELVYNDFYIGKNATVTIIAGCGIHNEADSLSQHDGIHSFYLEEGAHVVYVENHYGTKDGGKKILNPVTHLELGENSHMEIRTVQIEGVHSTVRETFAVLGDNASLIVSEKLLTTDDQYAETNFTVDLNGKGSSATVASRSVAKGHSKQLFKSKIHGNEACIGHSECDAIIMDHAVVTATPEVTAYHTDAMLIHEAAIGKIAGEQITKLMTLGLDAEAAEQEIIRGFLQ